MDFRRVVIQVVHLVVKDVLPNYYLIKLNDRLDYCRVDWQPIGNGSYFALNALVEIKVDVHDDRKKQLVRLVVLKKEDGNHSNLVF